LVVAGAALVAFTGVALMWADQGWFMHWDAATSDADS
jgi:hypothetical protein